MALLCWREFENMQNEWRKRNTHNETFIGRIFDTNKVTVGNYTYGILYCYTWGKENEHLSIGHYCSIADDVVFILGGNHHYHGVTTFPCKVKFMGYVEEAETKGEIIVGDDVWIGYRSIILSGVTIGQGAIIGAGSLVSHNVPPYSICGGNPINVIGWRYEQDVIKEMVKLDWSIVKPDRLCHVINKEINKENVNEIIKHLNN
jgi:acetyltransferase-like isoleucine patch superfamily enzyme